MNIEEIMDRYDEGVSLPEMITMYEDIHFLLNEVDRLEKKLKELEDK